MDAAGVAHERLAEGDATLLAADDAALEHKPVLVDLCRKGIEIYNSSKYCRLHLRTMSSEAYKAIISCSLIHVTQHLETKSLTRCLERRQGNQYGIRGQNFQLLRQKSRIYFKNIAGIYQVIVSDIHTENRNKCPAV